MEDDINCITLVLLFLANFQIINPDIMTNKLYVDYKQLLEKKNYMIPFEYELIKIEK